MPNNFSYNNGVPDGPDNPSDDQPDMKINTQSIDSIIAVDHIGFNTNGSGIHKQVTLLNQGAPGLGDGNGTMYANIVNGNSWPIWQNALGSNIMMSSETNASTNGYASLPGGLLIQWGAPTLDNNGNTIRDNSPFIFPISFLAANPPFVVMLSAQKSSTGAEGLWVKQGSVSVTGFSIKTSASAGQFPVLYFTAIGRIA